MEISEERKEEIFKKLAYTPTWISSHEDLFIYLIHVHYRLYQINEILDKEMNYLYQKYPSIKIDEECGEITRKIYCEYDYIYTNLTREEKLRWYKNQIREFKNEKSEIENENTRLQS
ncbi:MAG TPA: hypothetical protein VNW29_04295 [Candidatus Sulfotelmatobacter sp.]|nr:hypothetical protein [Candidatus Sulfotelmatobacter sp.]